MTWTVAFRQDTVDKGVGTLTATFNDGSITCSVTDRTDTNGDFGGFIQRCRDALAESQKASGDTAAIRTKIETVLNGG